MEYVEIELLVRVERYEDAGPLQRAAREAMGDKLVVSDMRRADWKMKAAAEHEYWRGRAEAEGEAEED